MSRSPFSPDPVSEAFGTLTTIVTTLIDHIDPALLTGEPFAGIGDLARAIGAEGIARDARRLDERTRGVAGQEPFRARVFEQLCVRLHHHVETMSQALSWTEADENSRVHALTICRLLCETALERCAGAFAAGRVRLARELEIERTKFLMATTVDARIDLDGQVAGTPRRTAWAVAGTLGLTTVGRFRTGLQPVVAAAIEQVAHGTLRELYGAFGDLARSAPELTFTLLDLEVMTLRARALHVRKARDAHHVLVAVLEDGSRAATEDALDRYELARTELEQRTCELLDDAIAATRACGVFARTARNAGPMRLAEVRQQLRSWAMRLDPQSGRAR